ncbi:MAG TPA: DUF1345 domain-containing protein [Galbitalea sp.]
MSPEAAATAKTRPKPQPEHRWAAFISIAAALTLYFFIPQKDQPIPHWIVPTIGALFLIPQVVLNPTRLVNERVWSRWMSIILSSILVLVNQVTIVLVLRELIVGNSTGPQVLLTATMVWVTNVIAFAFVYWELDLGGPFARRLHGSRETQQMDFRFPQHDGAPGNKDWEPAFFDYAYFSLSNMMAFSPTDVMPMTTRAKALMGYQAMTGFALLALVISRAVNILH